MPKEEADKTKKLMDTILRNSPFMLFGRGALGPSVQDGEANEGPDCGDGASSKSQVIDDSRSFSERACRNSST